MKPLRNRINVVVSRQTDLQALGVWVVPSIEAALDLARQNGETEAFLIGGQQIYTAGMALADKIYLTRIHTQLDGDTFFPTIDLNEWTLTNSESHINDPKSDYPYTFNVWQRKL